MSTPAVIIDIHDPSPTSIIADVELEIARLRRLVGSVWAARDAGQAELANVLLEAHEAGLGVGAIGERRLCRGQQ